MWHLTYEDDNSLLFLEYVTEEHLITSRIVNRHLNGLSDTLLTGNTNLHIPRDGHVGSSDIRREQW